MSNSHFCRNILANITVRNLGVTVTVDPQVSMSQDPGWLKDAPCFYPKMLFLKAPLLGVLRVRQGRFRPSGSLSRERSCPCVYLSLYSGLTKALVVFVAKSPYVIPQISSHSLKRLGRQYPVTHCPSSNGCIEKLAKVGLVFMP